MSHTDDHNRAEEVIGEVRQTLAFGDTAHISDTLSGLHPAQIADLLESLPTRERDELWRYIAPELEGDVLTHIQDGVRTALLEQMQPEQVAAVTKELETDDAADILQDLPHTVVDEVLQSLDAQNRSRIASALSYPEDTAGGLMNIDVVTVRSDVALETVIRYLRWQSKLPAKTDTLIVVDRDNKYLGLLPLTTVLCAAPEAPVSQVMDTQTEVIAVSTPSADVAKLFEQRDLLSAAVVNDHGQLLGRITVDDVVDVIRGQSDHSLMSLAGLDEEDDMFAPVLTTTKRRAMWLGVNLATAFLAAWVIGRFEHTIEQLVALAILMPVVASMGGIAGSQTLTIVIRALALGQVSGSNARALLFKELAVAVVNGLLWASVVGLIAFAWFGSLELGAVFGAAILINLFAAAFTGALLPLSLKAMHIDPALAGGVILTTVTDVVGFMSFLGLATLFLL
ncbi:MAG: magnesium transporter [Gammaproteobacteria bacterium]